MAQLDVQFFSPALNKHTNYSVLLPERGEGPFPVLLQLHGLTDNHRSWLLQSSINRHVEGYPFIVVLPDGGTSCYLNWNAPDRVGRADYEDLMVRDLRAHVSRHFAAKPGPWAIGGLSMGGYGSMRLGLKYPDLFSSIWAHSSAFHINEIVDSQWVADHDDLDVFQHAAALANRPASERPAIAFDCGTEDELLRHNRDLHARMDELGIAHTYQEHPGGHTWDYWDDHVREALARHAEVFGVERIVSRP
ncbi:MAG: alpha/beta hydrolase family protein [Thermomicrobiales bacterium]